MTIIYLDNRPSGAVRRNPSRLYRVVRPLTEVTHAPSPATKRCIGPEFVVVGESDPVTLDLHCAQSRSAPCRTVQVSFEAASGLGDLNQTFFGDLQALDFSCMDSN